MNSEQCRFAVVVVSPVPTLLFCYRSWPSDPTHQASIQEVPLQKRRGLVIQLLPVQTLTVIG